MSTSEMNQTGETHLTVSGMSCGSCKRHVGDALRAVPGVSAVEVDVTAGRARVQHAPDVAPARLVAAVVAAGFGARPS